MVFVSKLIKSTERKSVTPNSIHIGRKYRKWDEILFKVLTIVQGYSKWLSELQQLVIHNTLEQAVYLYVLFI